MEIGAEFFEVIHVQRLGLPELVIYLAFEVTAGFQHIGNFIDAIERKEAVLLRLVS